MAKIKIEDLARQDEELSDSELDLISGGVASFGLNLGVFSSMPSFNQWPPYSSNSLTIGGGILPLPGGSLGSGPVFGVRG